MKFVETLKKWFTENPETTKGNTSLQASEELEVATANAKIDRALTILETNDVCTNIVFLLNNCDFRFATESVRFEKTIGDSVSAKDFGQKEWITVDAVWAFSFAEKKIEFATVNMNAWGVEFGDTRETGTLVVRANHDVVFETFGCGKGRGAYDIGWAYDLHISAKILDSFKAGEWMADLKFLVSEKKKYDLEIEKQSKMRTRDEIKDKARKIDLG